MQWCHWQWQQHHVRPVLSPMVSHDQKSNAGLYFNLPDLTNAMVPFRLPLTSCDASASAKYMTWPKSHVASHIDHLDQRSAMVPCTMLSASKVSHNQNYMVTSFWSSWLNRCIAALMMHLTSHDAYADANVMTWPKNSCFISFWSSWPNKCNDDIAGIMWH